MTEFKKVSDSSSPDFEDALGIYMEAFPENERQTIDKLKFRIDTGHSEMIIAKRDSSVIGVSLLCPFRELGFGLLDYMAVETNHRVLGIGSALFTKTFDLFKRDVTAGLLLLEVEDPSLGNPLEKTIRLRRIRFYQRLGAKMIPDFKYLMPPMSSNMPTNMLLMICAETNRSIIDYQTLVRLITAIYSKVYEREADDPYLRQMLENLKGHKFLTDSSSLRSEII